MMRDKCSGVAWSAVTIFFLLVDSLFGFFWYLSYKMSVSELAENLRNGIVGKFYVQCSDKAAYTSTVIMLTIMSAIMIFLTIYSICEAVYCFGKEDEVGELTYHDNDDS